MRKLRLKPRRESLLIIIALIAPLAVSSAAKNKKGKSSPTEQSPVSEGEELFKKNCNMCHFADKTDKKIAPGLKDLFKNKELPQSHKPATEANVREQIEKGSKVMPAFGNKLTPTEIDDLLEYLKTL